MQFWFIKSLLRIIKRILTRNFFFTLFFYPKKNITTDKASNFEIESKFTKNLQFTIVVQGPIILDQDFTIETLKLYRKNFPDAFIILSTWPTTKKNIRILKKLNIKVLENLQPKNKGISNINLQIVSSRNGILLAKKMGAKFVLKTRTDQRIYHPNLKNYLFNFINTFPLKKKYMNQKYRLVGISLNTFKYRLYGVSDMFVFGHIKDVMKYFSPPLDNRNRINNTSSDLTWKSFSKLNICEVYFCTNFLKKIGRKINYTLSDSLKIYRDHFIILDYNSIKLYWHKYTLNNNRYEHFGFFDPQLSFCDWLMLYNLKDSIKLNNSILNKKFRSNNKYH